MKKGVEMSKRIYTIEFITEMLGTVPMDPEVYRTYIESKKPETLNEEDEYLTVEKIEEKGWTGFHKDEKGPFLFEYVVKGFLKHAGNVLKDVVKIKALRSKLDDFAFVMPRRIYLPVDKPDGVLERPLRASTAKGPRVTLARSDYINPGRQIEFTISLIPHPELKWKIIDELLEYGKLAGLGQFRNGGYGRFFVVKWVAAE